MGKLKLIFLVSLLSGKFLDTSAQEILLVDQNTLFVPVVNHLIVKEDTSSIQNLMIVPRGKFKHVKGKLHFSWYGIDEEIWLYARVKNESTQTNWYLVFDNPMIDKIHIFIVRNGKIVKEQRFGDRFKVSEKPFDSRALVFPMEVAMNEEQEMYINIDTDGRETNPVMLMATQDRFNRWELKRGTEFSIFFGFVSLLALVSLYLSWIFKDNLFRWLSAFLATSFMLYFCSSGYAQQYLWPEYPEIGQRIPILVLLLYLFFILGFCRLFLLETISGKLINKIFFGLMAMSAVFMTLIFYEGIIMQLLVRVVFLIIPLVYALTFGVAIYSYRKRHQSAQFFVLGIVIIAIALILYNLSDDRESHVLTSQGALFSFALGSIFVFFSTLDRLRILKEYEKNHQLYLEKERIGRDLHDNIGAQLTLVASGLNRLSQDSSYETKKLEYLYESMNSVIVELRDTIWAINKIDVTFEEMVDKINTLLWRLRQNNENIDYRLNTSEIVSGLKIKSAIAVNLFRILQESIQNIRKHSQATAVLIDLNQKKDLLELVIRDNGKGFNIGTVERADHYGLMNMKKRAQEILANISINSEIEKGTEIRISIHLSEKRKKTLFFFKSM